jgi:hypothetical protein
VSCRHFSGRHLDDFSQTAAQGERGVALYFDGGVKAKSAYFIGTFTLMFSKRITWVPGLPSDVNSKT